MLKHFFKNSLTCHDPNMTVKMTVNMTNFKNIVISVFPRVSYHSISKILELKHGCRKCNKISIN